MNNDFNILMDFMAVVGPEVTGRVLEAPTAAEAQMMKRLARGQATGQERRAVCTRIQRHPKWTRYLARQIIESQRMGKKEEVEDMQA